MEEGCHHINKNPLNKAGLLSKVFFTWLGSLLKTGYKRPLTLDDLYNVTYSDSSEKLSADLSRKWKEEVLTKKKPSLLRAVLKNFGGSIFAYSILGFTKQCFKLSLPLQLAFLMRYIDNGDDRIDQSWAYVTTCTIAMATLLLATLHHSFFFGMQRIGMRIRIALCSMVYKKSLKLSHSSIGKANAGHVVNLMSNDVVRFDTAFHTMPFIVLAPLEMIFCYYVIQDYIGIAALPGFSLLLALIAVQSGVSRCFSTLRAKVARLTDRRIHLMTEVLAGIRVIKLYCWEEYFTSLLVEIRKQECVRMLQSALLKAVVICSPYYSTVKLSIGVSVVFYTVCLGHTLTSRAVFIVIGLYNVLRIDVCWLMPYSFQQISEIRVSLMRIQQFLLLDEYSGEIENEVDELEVNDKTPLLQKNLTKDALSDGVVTQKSHQLQDANNAVEVRNLSTPWRLMSGTVPILEDLNFDIKKGEFVAIVGSVGSGKTSLLMSLLGELPVTSTSRLTMSATMTTSLAAQEPWIFSSSLRQNVLFGQPMRRKRYNKALKAVSLDKDISNMDEGDSTLVGERGMSLSGGQRSRVGLARAVYSTSRLVLMDDPLSAVDSKVGRHLFDKCMKGVLKDRTRILVTHQLQYLKEVDRIMLLVEGRIAAFDTYSNLEKDSRFIQFMDTTHKSEEEEQQQEKEHRQQQDVVVIPEQEVEKIRQNDFGYSVENNCFVMSIMSDSSMVQEIPAKKIAMEDLTTGNISYRIYMTYICQGANWAVLLLSFVCSVALNVSNVFNDVYLAKWSDEQRAHDLLQAAYLANGSSADLTYLDDVTVAGSKFNGTNVTLNPMDPLDTDGYLKVYLGNIAFLSVMSALNGMLIYQILIKSSRILHKMLKAVIRAPVSFFDNNPVGRITNRFSKDTGQLDEIMPSLFYEFIKCVFSVLSIFVITVIPNPIILVIILPIVCCIFYVRNYYLRTSRESKRLEAATRSPVFTHASASMIGLTTVRAFSAQKIFEREFDKHQDQHTEAWFLFIACGRWMSLRMDVICSLFVYGVSIICVIYARQLSSGIVGLTLTYSFSLVNLFSWFIRQNMEVENMMTSVERVLDYTKLTSEAPLTSSDASASPPADWPTRGHVVSSGVSMSYAPQSPPALDRVDFDIKPLEKIGIVGRTGAGKSSLITMLFRLTEHSGSLCIDGVDISSIGLHELRSKISIIPQDPVLFVGTLRGNLDPFDKFGDDLMWRALKEVQILDSVDTTSRGLDTEVLEAGANFSVGQRQLLCLARALLNRNRILVIDEATANVDNYTDKLIQRTIKEKFSECTILTIAHRVHTIMDSDRIMVVDQGHIVEFDSPQVLLDQKEGYFYDLANKMNICNEDKNKKTD